MALSLDVTSGGIELGYHGVIAPRTEIDDIANVSLA